MKILSIVWPTSTAAVMIDGRIVACVSEERFSRIKNEDKYPFYSIEAVLKIAGVKAQEIDLVAFAGKRFDATAILTHKHSRFSVADRLKEQHAYWRPKLLLHKDISYLKVFKDKVDTRQYPGNWSKTIRFINKGDKNRADAFFQDFRRQAASDHLGIEPGKIIFVDHHRAHGFYAYYASPLKKDKTLILTADAWGDNMNASVSVADNKGMRLLSTSSNFIIGRLYRYITLLLGMKPDEHEYKVMGLAAYSKSKYYQKELAVFNNTMYVDGLKFAYKEKPSDLYFYFRDRLEGSRFDAIAGAVQKYTEDILVKWVLNALKYTGADKLCFGGGVAMNIKAMMEVAKLPQLDNLFVCPTPSDESLAMGAAYAVMHDVYASRGLDPRSRIKPLKDAYLGPDCSIQSIKSAIARAKAKGYAIVKDPSPGSVARLLADSKIIGRCAGRSEFGARALGNRTIMADPRNLQIIKVINEKIKSRDFWMPFAPSILSGVSDKYLVNPKKLSAPYMTIAFETREKARRELIAGLHQYDFTVRPQVVSRDINPQYHEIISEFYKLTGVGGILNTSFNIHGEPIVQTPLDAFDVLIRTDLDALLLDGYLIKK